MLDQYLKDLFKIAKAGDAINNYHKVLRNPKVYGN